MRRPVNNGCAVASLGNLNLLNGSSRHFNTFDIWGEDTTYEVYKVESRGVTKYKVVATSGTKPLRKVGESSSFISDQTGKLLFYGELVDYRIGTSISELADQYGRKLRAFTYK